MSANSRNTAPEGQQSFADDSKPSPTRGKAQHSDETESAKAPVEGSSKGEDPAYKREYYRKRNAEYSRRKYVRKKIEIEVLHQQKAQLTRENCSLRREESQLKLLLQEAEDIVRATRTRERAEFSVLRGGEAKQDSKTADESVDLFTEQTDLLNLLTRRRAMQRQSGLSFHSTGRDGSIHRRLSSPAMESFAGGAVNPGLLNPPQFDALQQQQQQLRSVPSLASFLHHHQQQQQQTHHATASTRLDPTSVSLSAILGQAQARQSSSPGALQQQPPTLPLPPPQQTGLSILDLSSYYSSLLSQNASAPVVSAAAALALSQQQQQQQQQQTFFPTSSQPNPPNSSTLSQFLERIQRNNHPPPM